MTTLNTHGVETPVTSALFHLDAVTKSFRDGPHHHIALKAVSLTLQSGELCAIVGASGSGKSTLLTLLGFLDPPTTGCLSFRGTPVAAPSADTLATLRNREIGFVFQSFHLLPRLTARDNVALPLLYRAMPRDDARARAEACLQRVGLGHRLDHRPSQMSGGQRQRVAIARALVGHPSILLADEPTGNLDSHAAAEIMDMLVRLNEDDGLTVVIVTHDLTLAARCKRQITIADGQITDDTALHAPTAGGIAR